MALSPEFNPSARSCSHPSMQCGSVDGVRPRQTVGAHRDLRQAFCPIPHAVERPRRSLGTSNTAHSVISTSEIGIRPRFNALGGHHDGWASVRNPSATTRMRSSRCRSSSCRSKGRMRPVTRISSVSTFATFSRR